MNDAVRHEPVRRPPSVGLPSAARARDPFATRQPGTDTDALRHPDALALSATMLELDAAAALHEQHAGKGDDGAGQHDSPSGEQPGETEPHIAPEALVDHRLSRLGQFVTHVHRVAQSQGSWSLSLPLDDELLPDTVLHLGYSPTLVTLHFETRDWTARDLLAQRTRALENLVRELLPPDCDVLVSV